jgi:hypothetical protein
MSVDLSGEIALLLLRSSPPSRSSPPGMHAGHSSSSPRRSALSSSKSGTRRNSPGSKPSYLGSSPASSSFSASSLTSSVLPLKTRSGPMPGKRRSPSFKPRSFASRSPSGIGLLKSSAGAKPAKVAAWFGDYKSVEMAVVPGDRPSAPRGAIIRNASDLPVLDIRAFFYYVDEVQPGAQWNPAMRGGLVERIRLLPPRSDGFIPMSANVHSTFGNVSINAATCVVSIEFTDANGNQWERDPRRSRPPDLTQPPSQPGHPLAGLPYIRFLSSPSRRARYHCTTGHSENWRSG